MLHILWEMLDRHYGELERTVLTVALTHPYISSIICIALTIYVLSAATNVSTYWIERDGGALHLNHSHPGQTMATSLLAVGLSSLSSSSRASTAERLAETALARDSDGSGGTAVWALSHCLAAEGRSAEMISKLAGFDGTQFYEGCGYLNFHTRMAGYGAIALLDRKGSGADRSALRLYDGGFGHILEYSGNNVEGVDNGGEVVCLKEMRVPRSIKGDMAGAVGSMFSGWFGGGGGESISKGTTKVEKEDTPDQPDMMQQLQRRTAEDVLCWLPPSPLLLTQATGLLLRLTLCDGISSSDHRWSDLAAAWKVSLQNVDEGSSFTDQTPIEFMPLALLASSLLVEPDKLHMKSVPPTLHSGMQGLHKMGELMRLGKLKLQSSSQSNADSVEEWKEVLQLLARARDSCRRWEMPTGFSSSEYVNNCTDFATSSQPIGWDFDTRQFIEYSLCHAALEVGDYESLCLARSMCSEGTTLRPNCPELWWRYGMVLDRLGDEVAAENARAASVSLGSGEGGASF